MRMHEFLCIVKRVAVNKVNSSKNEFKWISGEIYMEIERKFLVKKENLPENLEQYPSKVIEQGYLCTEPVVRIRKSNEDYYLTYKSKGLLSREEYNLPLTKEAYEHLKLSLIHI